MKLELVDNAIYIVPNSLKMKILDYLSLDSKIYNISFISLNEFEKHYFFDIKEEAIIYLLDKTNENLDILRQMLSNLYKIDVDKDYKESKLKRLRELYIDLEEKKYLIFDKGFKDYLKTKKIYILGYTMLDDYQKKMLTDINAVFLKINSKLNISKVYKYHSLKDELIATAHMIRKLNSEGINYNKIYLAGIDDNYNYLLRVIFNMFDIPYNSKEKNYLTSLITVKEYLKNKDINCIKNIDLKAKINKIEEDLFYANNSKYYDLLLTEALEKTSIDKKELKDAVNILNESLEIPYLISDDEYLFVLGFNQNYLPKIYKDEDYLSDNLKLKCNLITSSFKNKLSKENLLQVLGTVKNLTISYKLTSLTSEYAKSSLLNELDLEEIEEINYNYNYSNKFNDYKVSSSLDTYYKYHQKEKDFDYLTNNIDANFYTSFDHKFKGINREITPYSLSYSNLDDLFKCPFKYYLKYILKLDSFNENFNTKIGNIFHSVLKDSYNKNFSFEKSFDYAITKEILDNKEKFLLEKLKKELEFIVDNNKKMEKSSFLTEFYGEKRLEIPLNDHVTVKGFIDKILFKSFHNKTYYAVFDYKTGSATLNLDYLEDGLFLQLPLYVYLINRSKLFTNPVMGGFFYQFLLQNAKDEIEKQKNLKLVGYANSDEIILSYLDEDYKTNSFIKGLGVTKTEQLKSSSKVLNEEEIEAMLKTIEQALNKAINIIDNNNFIIEPKIIDNKNISCEYCPFKEVCFVDVNDYKYLQKKEGDY